MTGALILLGANLIGAGLVGSGLIAAIGLAVKPQPSLIPIKPARKDQK